MAAVDRPAERIKITLLPARRSFTASAFTSPTHYSTSAQEPRSGHAKQGPCDAEVECRVTSEKTTSDPLPEVRVLLTRLSERFTPREAADETGDDSCHSSAATCPGFARQSTLGETTPDSPGDSETSGHSDARLSERAASGDRPHACTLCDYKTRQLGHLTRHMKNHAGEKSHACTRCDYKTSRSESLVRHMRVHSGDKPFACKLCDYRTAHRHHLQDHERKHTGEKPYACKLCDYRAVTRQALRYHEGTHARGKPHTCSLCEFRAASEAGLNRHMKSHNKEYYSVLELAPIKPRGPRSVRLRVGD